MAKIVRSKDGGLQWVEDNGSVSASSNYWSTKRATTDQTAHDYNNFLYEVDTFQRQINSDFKSREGKYQSSDTLGRSKARTDERIAGMRKKMGEFRNYFGNNTDRYGKDTVSGVFAQLDDTSKFLDSVRDASKSEQDYWAQWETEDDYNTYTRRSSMDLVQSQKDLEAKRAELKKAEEELAEAQRASMSMPGAATGGKPGNTASAWDRAQAAQKKVDALKREIGLAEVDISEAENIQKTNKYAEKMEWTDLDKWAAKGAAVENPDFREVEGGIFKPSKENREAKVGNLVTYSIANKDELMPQSNTDPVDKFVGSYFYTYLTEDEVKLHNAILAKEGKDAAKEFLDYMMPTLMARHGGQQGKSINAIKNPLAKTALTGLYSVGAGVDQWASGIKQLATDEVQPTSPTQVASQIIQEDLGTVGKTLYSAGTTIGNMLPSIILANVAGGVAGGIAGAAGATAATAGKVAGTAGKAASALAMGGASAGNTYNQVMQQAAKEGYTKEQAQTYAFGVGASEAALSYLIGGAGNITGLGEETLLAKVAGLYKPWARLALSGVIRIGSEEVEELAQLWVEPALKSLILNTEFEAPTWEEHVETAIVTALSTFIMEGGNIVGTEIDYKKYGEYLLKKHSENAIIGEALANTKPTGAAHTLAEQLWAQKEANQALNPADIGRLHALNLYESQGKKYGTYVANNIPTRKADAKTETLVELAKSEDKATADYATAQLAHEGETVVSPIAKTLMDSGMKAADAVEQAALIMKVQAGQKLTGGEIAKLNLANESVRTVFNEATGSAVTDGQARNASQKRKVIHSAEEVAKAKADAAEAEKAREATAATEQATAEVVQQAQVQVEQATNRAKAESMAAAILEEQIALEEEARKAGDSIEYEDGSTQTQAEFVEAYRAQFPRVSEEEAISTFNDYKRMNNMGHKVPGSAATVDVAKDTNVLSKKKSGKGKRASVGEAETVTADNEGRTEAGKAKERELTLKELNRIAGKYGITVEMQDPDGISLLENENGFYDHSEKKIILNAKKATNQYMMTYYFVHELTHGGQAVDGDVKSGLTSDIIGAMEKLYGKEAVGKLIAATRVQYEAHFKENNKDLRALDKPNYIEDEVAANFLMKAIANRSLLDQLAGVTVKPHQALVEKAKAFLAGKKDTDIGVKEAQRLIDRLQTSLENAQKQGLKNLENSSTIDPKKREVRSSVERNEESADYRGWQDSGRVGGQGQLRHSPDESVERQGVHRSGDLGVHAGTLIPERTRKIMRDKGISDVGLTETDDRNAFSVALDTAKAANSNGGMVDSQSVEGLTESGARTFMRPDGGAGVAVEADGNIVGVFKNPALRVPRAVQDLLLTALSQGGNHLDCYATYTVNDLVDKYTQLGFEPVAWLEFSREYAPEDWNYEAWGEPDVVMFVHNGDTVEQIINREEPYRTWTKDDIRALPKFDDYDEAKAHQKSELEKRITGRRYSIDPEFSSDVDEWAASGKPDDWTLTLGSTGGVLQGLGAIENDIYILSDKMNQIMADQPEMGLEEIKKLPKVLEDPVLILNSKNKVSGNARILVFGQYKAANGKPLLGVLDLRPVENGIAITDMQKLTSAYTKTGTEEDVKYFFEASDILYADEKRAPSLLKTVGFSLPSELQQSDFLGSIAYKGQEVKIKGAPFSDILPEQDNNKKINTSPALRAQTNRHSSQYGVDYDRIIADKDPTVKPGPRKYSIDDGEHGEKSHPDAGVRYSIDPEFVSDVDEWVESGKPDDWTLIMGSTGGVLQGLGAVENDIYILSDKMNQIMADHPEMGVVEIKSIPEILENPVLVLKSKGQSKQGQNSRMVLFGSATARNGEPILVAFDLRPHEGKFVINDMQKVSSAYTKRNALNLISGSEVMYADKKRTIPLLRSIGLTIASRPLLRDGYVGSIAYEGSEVKTTGVPFSQIMPQQNSGKRLSIDPVTGYEEGSVEDKVLKLLRAGTTEDAIKLLEQWVADIEAGNIDADKVESSLKDAYFKAQPLTPQQRADNRKKLDDLVKKYGAIKPGAVQRDENGKVVSHQVILPNRVRDTKGVSDFARTLAEAKQTPEWFRDEINRAIADEMSGYTYDIATDKAAMQYIKGRKQVSFEHNLRLWENVVELGNTRFGTGGISKNDIALGEYLYTEAVKAGDVDLATKLAAELATVGTAAGQVVQAMSLLKKMTPSGKLYYLIRTIERLNNQYQKKIDAGKMAKIKYDKDLAAAVLNAKTTEEAQKAMDALLQDVANQVPSTLMEKWNAWRYLAMLGNPKTHIRNVLSNAVFAPVVWLKDLVDATLFQPFVKRENRTKHFGMSLSNAVYGLSSVLTLGAKPIQADRYTRFATEDFAAMGDTLRGGGKYNPADLIREMRPVFKTKAMNALSKGNSALLEWEDGLFLKAHYVRALSHYLAAQKADVASLNSTPEGRNQLAKARAWAVQEAQKATFRDASAVASALNRLEKIPVLDVVVGGVLPFKKTPINILKRGLEYNPLGIIGTTYNLAKGKADAAKTLDSLAANFTGAGLLVLGIYLAREGLLRASGSDDEKERELEELQGAQLYSFVRDDGTSYTIDWMAPAALPLFIGAKVYETFSENQELSHSDFVDTLMMVAEPMFQLSMLDGLNKTLTSVSYSDNKITAFAESVFSNYFGQAIPTLLGQIARTVDDTRRSTYIDKNKDTVETLDRTVQYNMTKVPGVSKNLAPRLDAWGRSDTESNAWLRALENFISPGYVSTMKTSSVEEELERLYKVTGDGSVLPKSVSKYFNVNKVRRDLTADEWVTYQTEAGQGAYEMLTRLVNSASYKGLSDAQRAKAVKDVFTYADEKAKEAAVSDYATDESWIAKADKLAGSGISVEDYIVQSVLGDETQGQNTKDVLGMEWLDEEDKALLVSSAYTKGIIDDNTFTDPSRNGYEYTLTADQVEEYNQHFDELWTREYNKLIAGRRYTMATLDEQADMVDALKKEVAADTKKWMARQLRSDGIRSTKKD